MRRANILGETDPARYHWCTACIEAGRTTIGTTRTAEVRITDPGPSFRHVCFKCYEAEVKGEPWTPTRSVC